MTRWVFDLDNTLVATADASSEAYRRVGVEPPSDFAVRPWQQWCPPDRYAARCDLYPEVLAERARPLPALEILRALGGRILTNSSERSYRAVLALFPELGQYETHLGVDPGRKLAWLLREQEEGSGPGVYVDDNVALVARVRRETRWQVLSTCGY